MPTIGITPAGPATATAHQDVHSDRLPAKELDAAILQAIINTYADTSLFDKAITMAVDQHTGRHEQYEAELKSVELQISKDDDHRTVFAGFRERLHE